MAAKGARIAFLLPAVLFNYRGIGTFSAGVFNLAKKNGWWVDVVSDAPPKVNDIYRRYQDLNWFTPDQPLDYDTHRKLFFWKDGLYLERIINLRQALMRAMSRFTYDLIFCSTPEAAIAAHTISVSKAVKVVYYTHYEESAYLERKNDVFTPETYEWFRNVVLLPSVTIGTQSLLNKERIKRLAGREDGIYVLPCSVPDEELWTTKVPTKKKDGVGIIAGWETRKNCLVYLKALKEAGLPGVVLTTKTSGRKFVAKAKEMGVELDMHIEVTGQAKANAIAGMKLAYHPSQSETFGIGVMETAMHCPTFVLTGKDWIQAHRKWVYAIDENKDVEVLSSAYSSGGYKAHMDEVRAFIDKSEKKWEAFMEMCLGAPGEKEGRNDLVRALKKSPGMSVEQWLAQVIENGGQVRHSELEKLCQFKNNPGARIIQTRANTWLTFSKKFVPKEESRPVEKAYKPLVRMGF